MRKPKEQIISCPICGAEYLPAEIYYPDSFLGKPTFIDKDHMTQTIECYLGKNMNLTEHYICDNCKTPFKVTARVQFVTQEEKDINFNEDYSTKLNGKEEKLFLNEL